MKPLSLERVIGNTITHNSSTSSGEFGYYAYTAGCAAVVVSRDGVQEFFVASKPLSCLSISSDGKFLAAGEKGHQPKILIWDIESKVLLGQLKGHTYGVSTLHFSPDSNNLLASVGFQHDGFVYVWDWAKGKQVGVNKVKGKVYACRWIDGENLITVGHRFVKFWKVIAGKSPLEGKGVILGDHMNETFIDVDVCSRGIFAVTCSGLLVFIDFEKRKLDKWVNLQMKTVSCVHIISDAVVACGGQDGVIRLFHTESMQYISTLPIPSGKTVASGVLACQSSSTRVVAFYTDSSIVVWDVADPDAVSQKQSQSAHTGVIWDVQTPREVNEQFPAGSFATCGADGTVRVWYMDGTKDVMINALQVEDSDAVLYESPVEMCASGSTSSVMNVPDTECSRPTGDKGVKCVRLSDDSCHLACGDRAGNLHVWSTHDWSPISSQAAHNSEVLSLDYSRPEHPTDRVLLASSSRDRLCHVFDATQHYALTSTLEDHSSSVTSIRFGSNKLLSCSADKSIVSRQVDDDKITRESQKALPHGTLFDIAVDPMQKFFVTAGQDKKLNIYAVSSGKQVRSKPLEKGTGDMLRVTLDPSGTYVAMATSKKQVALYDFYSGNKVCSQGGHAGMITGVAVTPDCRYLISCSADGCIFCWKIADSLSREMRAGASSIPPPVRVLEPSEAIVANISVHETSPLDFSVDGMPAWVQGGSDAQVVAAVTPEKPTVANLFGTPTNITSSKDLAKLWGTPSSGDGDLFGGTVDDELFFDMSEQRRKTVDSPKHLGEIKQPSSPELEDSTDRFQPMEDLFSAFAPPAEEITSTRMSLSSQHFKSNVERDVCPFPITPEKANITSVKETVPKVEETTSQAEESTTAVEEPVSTAKETTSQAEESTTAVEEPVSTAEETTSQAEESTTAVEEPVSTVEETTSQAEESTTAVEEPVSTVEETTSQAEESTTAVEEPVSTAEETTSQAEESTTAVEEPVSTVEETTSQAKESTTAVEEPVSNVELSTPQVEESTIAVEELVSTVEETTSQAEESTTAVEEPVSTVELSTPQVEESTTAVEEPVSTVEETTSQAEESTTAVEEPVSTVEETTSQAEESTTAAEEPVSTVELSTPELEKTSNLAEDPINEVVEPLAKVTKTEPVTKDVIVKSAKEEQLSVGPVEETNAENVAPGGSLPAPLTCDVQQSARESNIVSDATPTTPQESTAAPPQETPVTVKRRRQIAAEVEKTRERLARMGLLHPRSSNQLSDITNATKKESSTGMKKLPRPVEQYKMAAAKLEKAAEEFRIMSQEIADFQMEQRKNKTAIMLEQRFERALSKVSASLPFTDSPQKEIQDVTVTKKVSPYGELLQEYTAKLEALVMKENN